VARPVTRKIVVAGATSLYLSVGVAEFPVSYVPSAASRWLAAGVSGAACHIARVLHALGDQARLCTVVGSDPAGAGIRTELGREGLLGPGVIDGAGSSLGVVLVARDGRRMGFPHLVPVDQVRYPFEVLREEAGGADLLVLTNAKFVRPLVGPAAGLGIPIAVDAHLITDLAGDYNRPWLNVAQIIFCSHERLPRPAEQWVPEVFDRYPRCLLTGVGLGARGALLGTRDGRLIRVAAVAPRGVVSTSGAGDALFATFLHTWLGTGDAVRSLQAAVLHAGWKIGHQVPAGASLTSGELAKLLAAHPPPTSVGRWDG
jgi:sugar/nucleoside kinase (ribokinase family)